MSSSVPQWHAVVPVKQLSHAKSRMQLDPSLRAELTLAMAIDTVAAVQSSPLVAKCWLVTADPQVMDHVAPGDVDVLQETVSELRPANDVNAALVYAVGSLRATVGDLPIAVFVADLPSLRENEVTSTLEQASGCERCFVPDWRGTGTTALMTSHSSSFEPDFGIDSRAHHEAIGLIPLAAERGLRHDVDTLDDLAVARRYGVGRHTADVIARRLL